MARLAADTVRKAHAVGLVDDAPDFAGLTYAVVQKVISRAQEAGVGAYAAGSLARTDPSDTDAIVRELRRIESLIEESPLPDTEWPRLLEVFDRDGLAALVGVSPSSVARYERGERQTPDEVAARLHFLALLVGDLAAAYNALGIRRWFDRPRTALDGRRPAARWHAPGQGPAHYFSDTPDGAWAEFLRHEEIQDAEDLDMIRRAMWAVEIGDEPAAKPDLPLTSVTGDPDTYDACQHEAARLRAAGATRLDVLSAALAPGGAHGHVSAGQLRPGPLRDPTTIVLFGPRPSLVGWRAAYEGRPAAELLTRVHHLTHLRRRPGRARRLGGSPPPRAPAGAQGPQPWSRVWA